MKRVKTYYLDVRALENEAVFNQELLLMPAVRRDKINRIKSPADKRLSLGAGILIKNVLHANEDDFTYGDNNKPYAPGICFNLSHSGDTVIMSVADCEVGCDIEKPRDINTLKIAKRFFFGTEYETLKNAESEDERRDLFFRLWTLKESFMKVTGKGLSMGLDNFCVNLTDPPIIRSTAVEGEFCFCEYEMSGCKIAVCAAENAEFEPYLTEVTL